MIEERFGIALTLVRRELEDWDIALGRLGQRAGDLTAALPAERTRLAEAEREREARGQARPSAGARRTQGERRLGGAELGGGRLPGGLALGPGRVRPAGP